MPDRQRVDDMPAPLRWFLIMYKQVGFPMMVCGFLAYMYFVDQPKSRNTMSELMQMFAKQTDAIMALKTSVDQTNKLLRHKKDMDW